MYSPNPTVSDFKIRLTSTDRNKLARVRVLDLQGRGTVTHEPHAEGLTSFGSQLKPGTYLGSGTGHPAYCAEADQTLIIQTDTFILIMSPPSFRGFLGVKGAERLKRFERFERLKRLKRFERFERLKRLKGLKGFEGLKGLEGLERVGRGLRGWRG